MKKLILLTAVLSLALSVTGLLVRGAGIVTVKEATVTRVMGEDKLELDAKPQRFVIGSYKITQLKGAEYVDSKRDMGNRLCFAT